MKKISVVLVVLESVFVLFGIISFSFYDNSTNNNEVYQDDDKDDVDDKLIVNTSSIHGDEINSSMYDYYKVNNLIEEEIKSEDLSLRNKYIFAYSDDFSNVIVGNNAVKANGLKTSFSAFMAPTSYTFDINHFIEYYKRLGFDLFQTYESKDDIKISDYSVKYVKIIAKKSNNIDFDNYREQFIIFIKESDVYQFVARYEIIDSRFTDKILTDFLKKIKIEKNTAKYLYTSLKDGKINGTLKQNAESDISSIYEVSYDLDSSKYTEVENGYNAINYHSFSSKNNSNIDIVLKTIVYGDNAEKDFFEETEGTIYENFKDSKVVDSSSSTLSLNGKNYIKLIFNFNTKDDKSMYKVSYAYKIEGNVYYVVNIISDSLITDSVFEDFTNITYKKT